MTRSFASEATSSSARLSTSPRPSPVADFRTCEPPCSKTKPRRPSAWALPSFTPRTPWRSSRSVLTRPSTMKNAHVRRRRSTDQRAPRRGPASTVSSPEGRRTPAGDHRRLGVHNPETELSTQSKGRAMPRSALSSRRPRSKDRRLPQVALVLQGHLGAPTLRTTGIKVVRSRPRTPIAQRDALLLERTWDRPCHRRPRAHDDGGAHERVLRRASPKPRALSRCSGGAHARRDCQGGDCDHYVG